MRPRLLRSSWFVLSLLFLPGLPLQAADLVTVSAQTWESYVPGGKEVDAIAGDFAMANDQLRAVIARPVRGRNANMTVRDVGGGLIDLARRDRDSDQLSAFYPGARQRALKFAGIEVRSPESYEASDLDRVYVRAESVSLLCVAEPREGDVDIALKYTLEDGWPFLRVETTFTNNTNRPVGVELVDAMRADRTFEKAPNDQASLFWVYDKWFGQAYGLLGEDHEILSASDINNSTLRYLSDGKSRITLEPGQSHRLVRRIFPGADLLQVRAIAQQIEDRPVRPIELTVTDTAGQPVAEADVVVTTEADEPFGSGRTDGEGSLRLALPASGSFQVEVSHAAYGSESRTIGPDADDALAVELPEAGYVVAAITDEDGGPIPCKVQFAGRDGTETPFFGPDSGEHAVHNLYYSHDGRFRHPLSPGRYEAIISRGPEYDAVFTSIEVERGRDTPLDAKLVRTVDTTGWVSSDFHSHASPSGDNTASQFGRVLNLLAEHIEFAPCTEHNRISSYVPHLKRLDAEHLMATCSGIELTNRPLPINHQNAFPLVMRPFDQDGGAPLTDDDPEVQIERLALWDGNSEKLVQVNHPDIGWMFFDRDGDGQPDGGFSGMVSHMDVIEVHPPHFILEPPTMERNNRIYNNTIFNWLQLLNQGYRIPGVVNTDAHYNFHGSGWLRNYLKSPTDDPAAIETLDIVRAAERGQIVMSNGPFLEVRVRSESGEAIPGEDLSATDGKATLSVRVQCPNWFDIDRVQVFLNGRPDENLNFTRASHSDQFSDGVVTFEQEIPLGLETDTHVIVVAVGEQSKLGIVMGPDRGEAMPIAVSNPVFVDVDGNGFQPNQDTLDAPLPVKGGR